MSIRPTPHAETSIAQSRKGRKYVTRAVNVHVYMQDEERPIVLVDADTGQEIALDLNMVAFIAETVGA